MSNSRLLADVPHRGVGEPLLREEIRRCPQDSIPRVPISCQNAPSRPRETYVTMVTLNIFPVCLIVKVSQSPQIADLGIWGWRLGHYDAFPARA